MYNLKNEFERIKNKGWICSTSCGRGNGGMTFEKELGLSTNQFAVPDYNGIEIKTKQDNTAPKFTLFSATFDGEFLFEMKRIWETYGVKDSSIAGAKHFYLPVRVGIFSIYERKYKFELEVDYKEERVYLCIYDLKGNLVERQSYWTFSLLQQKIECKLNYLAFVNVRKKKINGKEYFQYYKITFYKLKGFSYFLKLLEESRITVLFKVDVYKRGTRLGNYYDHGTSFDIPIKYLDRLFEKIEI